MQKRPETAVVRAKSIIADAFSGWARDKVSLMAASLSYFTLISVTPLLILVLTATGMVYGPGEVENRVFSAMRLMAGDSFTNLLKGWILRAELDPTRWLATLAGIVIILYGSSQVFTMLQRAMRELWGAPPPRSRRFRALQLLKTRTSSFLMVIGIGTLWFAAMFAGTVLAAWDAWLGESVPRGVTLVRLWHLVMTVLVYGLFSSLIYRYLAPVKVAWKDVWVGAIAFAILSGIGQKLLGWYMEYTTVSTLYGAAGSLVVILLWFYYSWLVFFLGVEFTIACRHHRDHRAEAAADPAPTRSGDAPR